ncbi:DUF5071 domain-containing protein [Flavobacterium rhizosphaerae]|uniref:DUF5071 domain-containing protein n=1 Tax=Flavobacterium rhizosphaerae TaxID=3163298 RepID=A0ABW8YV99_9FLAO
MKDYTYLVPKDKFDDTHIEELNTYSISEIRSIVPALLEWLQDANWPVSRPISEYFSPYINQIQEEIVSILKSDDEVWKYWILLLLIDCGYKPGNIITEEIVRIVNEPISNEILEEVHELAVELSKRLNKI